MAWQVDDAPFSNPFFSVEDKDWVKSIEERYAREDYLRDCVRRGDVENAVSTSAVQFRGSAMDDFSYLMSNRKELAQLFCRVSNVSLRIAAREGGVPALYLHNLSEKYTVIIYKTNDMRTLLELPTRMARQYATLVRDFSARGYSKLINRAVQYLSAHILEKINIHEMAEALFVSEAYLCRRFKAETGKTITAYVNVLRIEMAKTFLLQGDHDITNIAIKTGFHDSSYFSKVFHKYTGISPTHYAKQHQEKALAETRIL